METRETGGIVLPITTFTNGAGEIRNMVHRPMASFAELRSRRGAVRANHFHKSDWHYAYVSRGTVMYFERSVGSTEIPEPQTFCVGDTFYTPPNREHAMLFTEDSTILTVSGNERTHDNHEADLVRVEFITPAIAEKYLGV